jgi:hypothetical protein
MMQPRTPVRPNLPILFGAAALCLACVVAFELRGATPAPPALAASRTPAPVAAKSPPGPGAKGRSAQQVSVILARPLFTPGRRPEAADAAAASVDLARLTGILVGPSGKAAIFAGRSGGKPVVIEEGARIGRYVIGTIEANAVTVIGPEGTRVLHPSFDPSPPAVAKPVAVTPPAVVRKP